MPDLTTDVRYVKGIGEQRAKALQKLRIRTLRDLISYFPKAYDDRRTYKKIKDLEEGETACVEAMAAAAPTLSRVRRGLELVKLRAVDETGTLDVTFFNQVYMKDNLKAGETYTFFGRAEAAGRRRSMTNPLVEREGSRVMTGRIMPVYPLTAGISQLTLVKAVEQGLAACRDLLPDPLPDQVRRDHQLCHIGYAYDQIHFPASEEELAIARRRLVFEELFLLAIGLKRLRRRREALQCAPWERLGLEDFYGALPFALTGAQRRAIGEIVSDLSAGRPMNRLVQGDVGSGKTMVAAAAMVCAARSGRQAALMAPTEILAEQHHRGLAPLLEGLGISCALLTGGMPARARRAVLAGLESGETQVVIGTHALISAGVAYRRLGLVVTDEQHRFGVKQRETLSLRGGDPHVLVMSATPIPRTLAMILYGDLDISVIDELPAKRLPIKNCVVGIQYRPTAYRFIEKQIAQGRQAYVICPMVEESEGLEGENVLDYAKRLQEALPREIRISPLHGKMKPKEKTGIMERFARHELDVLVSTTVIEVGVDVPNATVMMVENAERFGLAQLHQLRGRVGRGEHQSYCIFVQGGPDEEIKKRLEILNHSNDGFHIAAEDLKLRGPGDLFGIRQSGMMDLRIGDIYKDSDVLRQASQAAQEMLGADPYLERPEYKGIREKVEAAFKEGSFHATL